MNGGFATHRGSFLFKMHKGAYLPKETRAAGHVVYDPAEILATNGVDANGAETGRPVCEGYAAFMFGVYRNAGAWCTMRKRAETKKRFPYDGSSKKREALRVTLGTSLLAPETGGLVGEGGDGEDGDFGGGSDTDDDESANTSPNKRKKKKKKRTEVIRVGESDLRARVVTWRVHWGGAR